MHTLMSAWLPLANGSQWALALLSPCSQSFACYPSLKSQEKTKVRPTHLPNNSAGSIYTRDTDVSIKYEIRRTLYQKLNVSLHVRFTRLLGFCFIYHNDLLLHHIWAVYYFHNSKATFINRLTRRSSCWVGVGTAKPHLSAKSAAQCQWW